MMGPERIEAGLAPFGLVIHAYDLATGELLVDRVIPGWDAAHADEFARADMAATDGHDVVLVVYDGDDGHRWPGDALRAGLEEIT